MAAITLSAMSNWDDLADDLEAEMIRAALEEMHEEYAQGVADAAREAGLTSADDIEIQIEKRGETDDPRLTIDVDRVRARANAILSENPTTD